MTPSSPWWLIGWRNLARNRRRTFITALGLGVGYFAVVFIVGWADGLTAQMVENGTGLVNGQLQVHASDYRPERSLYDTIGGRVGTDVAAILEAVAADPAVVAASPRVYADGLCQQKPIIPGMFHQPPVEFRLHKRRLCDIYV